MAGIGGDQNGFARLDVSGIAVFDRVLEDADLNRAVELLGAGRSSRLEHLDELRSLRPNAWLDTVQLDDLRCGDPVALWPDASGAQRDLSQQAAAARPTYDDSNGAACVRFDGADDHLQGLPALRTGTLIFRVRFPEVPPDGKARAFVNISRDGRYYAQIVPGNGRLRIAVDETNTETGHSFAANSWYTIAVRKSDTDFEVRVDGAPILRDSYQPAPPPRRMQVDSPKAPEDLQTKYASTVAELKREHEVLEGGMLAHPGEIFAAAQQRHLELTETEVDFNAYQEWLNRVDYPTHYPSYVREFPPPVLFAKKSLQHFLSFELLRDQLENDNCVYMDVASSNSIVPDILARTYGLTTIYRQDLRYPAGVHGRRIGSDAAAIPLDDATIDAMALHCALEHFENESDIGLVREAARLLRPGGAACVIPLYLADRYYVMTSRFAWERDGVPQIDPDATVVLREENRLKFSRHLDPEHLDRRLLATARQGGLQYRIVYYSNHAAREGCPPFALLLQKS